MHVQRFQHPYRAHPAPGTARKDGPDSSRRSERSRHAIYDAALASVAEVGYQRTTIEGIASRAGVGKQTIYRWWSSKADVLLEAFLDLSEQASEAAGGTPWEFPDTGDLAADLKFVLRATVDELLDPKFEAPSRALAAEGVVNARLGEQFVTKLLEPQLQLYVSRSCDRRRTAGRYGPTSTRGSRWNSSSRRSPSAGSSAADRSATAIRTPSSTTPCTASPRAERTPAAGSGHAGRRMVGRWKATEVRETPRAAPVTSARTGADAVPDSGLRTG